MMNGIFRTVIHNACLVLLLTLVMPASGDAGQELFSKEGRAGMQAATGGPAPEEGAVRPELVDRGKVLFTGKAPFAKGGAPCAACHSFRVPGIAGGNLAADLTDHHEGMGEEGLRDVLRSLDFPAMKKIYADRPLTDDEVAALLAFMKKAGDEKKEGPSALFSLALASFGVFAGCLVVLMFYNRRTNRCRLEG